MWSGVFNRLSIFALGICIGCDDNDSIVVFDVKTAKENPIRWVRASQN